MTIFDIVGPVMVGPSSSHTAGAARIGLVARKLMAEPIKKAEILFYGSFLATGKGHGTDCAVVAGLLGMEPDDERIPKSMDLAKKAGMEVSFGEATLKKGHPNSVILNLVGVSGQNMSVIGESLGGSLINIAEIDGQEANFSGERPTLIIHNKDVPGRVSLITGILTNLGINIATMSLYRSGRGGNAVMIIECDEEIPQEALSLLEEQNGVKRLIYYSLKEEET
jgi:L-serine dehydratase